MNGYPPPPDVLRVRLFVGIKTVIYTQYAHRDAHFPLFVLLFYDLDDKIYTTNKTLLANETFPERKEKKKWNMSESSRTAGALVVCKGRCSFSFLMGNVRKRAQKRVIYERQ